tara:strand:- start:1740 stop:2087 length:348 start_codon:yes stop_codon:yes gene_type:complete
MAHPANTFPKGFFLVNGVETVTGDFFAIQVLVATDASMTVKGSGIFEYLAADASDGSSHVDPSDGKPLGSTHAAGQYERLSTVSTVLPCVAGSTIYGSFNSVTGESGDQFIVYYK